MIYLQMEFRGGPTVGQFRYISRCSSYGISGEVLIQTSDNFLRIITYYHAVSNKPSWFPGRVSVMGD